MNNTLKTVITALVVALVVSFVAVRLVGNQSASFGAAGTGTNHYQAENFLQGLYAGTLGQFAIDRTGNVSTTATTTLTGVTALGNCGTASYTIPQLGPRTGNGVSHTTTTVSVPGSNLGDVALVSFASSTNPLLQYGIESRAVISSAGTSTVGFFNTSFATSTAITTGTLRVCFFR